MDTFSLSEFSRLYPDNTSCLEQIKKLKYPKGIYCAKCKLITKHYKMDTRPVFLCKFCRNHVSPLAGTVFEKSTTPLRLWFYVFFLMSHTRATISATSLQKELGVTYKTAWRMHTISKTLMKQNNGDLLSESFAIAENFGKEEKVRRWVFFNKIELTFAEKKEKR